MIKATGFCTSFSRGVSGERVLWEEQMGFFGKDKYIKKPEMRRFVIMFVSTGVSGLSSFFRLENSERVNFF